MTTPQSPPAGDDRIKELLREFMHNVEMNRLEYDKTGNDNYEWCLLNSISGLNAYILAQFMELLNKDEPTFIEPNHHLPSNDVRNGLRNELRKAAQARFGAEGGKA